MNWKLGSIMIALSVSACDMRTDPVVHGEMRQHIRERCLQGLYAYPDVIGLDTMKYCSCLTDELTEGKSRADIIKMEKNPALYMEPGEAIVRQCTAQASPATETGPPQGS